MGFKKKKRSRMIIISIYWTAVCFRSCIKYFTVTFSLVSQLPFAASAAIPFMDEKIEAYQSPRRW